MAPVEAPSSPVALVPLRIGGKSRLATALAPEDREALVLAMLDDVLAALAGAGVTDVRLLTGNVAAAAAAADRGLQAIRDPAPATISAGDEADGAPLRAAVDAGLATVPATVPRLVVAADLPRLSASDVRAVLGSDAEVAVAATGGGGTSLLRLAPGVTLVARYGPGSAEGHLRAAEHAGYSTELLERAGSRHDVDAADDLAALAGPLDGCGVGTATAAFLAAMRG